LPTEFTQQQQRRVNVSDDPLTTDLRTVGDFRTFCRVKIKVSVFAKEMNKSKKFGNWRENSNCINDDPRLHSTLDFVLFYSNVSGGGNCKAFSDGAVVNL
jgi:hypothetical protein